MKAAQEFHLSDALWVRIAPLLPVHTPKPHPLGCHRQRVADRQVRDGIFFILRTGCQGKALDATGICSGSTAHCRFQDRVQAGIWARLWDEALAEYDEVSGLAWNGAPSTVRCTRLRSGREPGPTPRTGAMGPALGGQTHPFRAQPLLAPAHPLGQKARELPGHVALFLCSPYVELLPIGIVPKREANPRNFYKADYLAGDVDVYAVMRALVEEELRREAASEARPPLPMRPDHDHQMLNDLSTAKRMYPGYPAIGRLRGLAELRGLEYGLRRSLTEVEAPAQVAYAARQEER